ILVLLFPDVLQSSQQIGGVPHHESSSAARQAKQSRLAAGAGIGNGRAQIVRIASGALASASTHSSIAARWFGYRRPAGIGLSEYGPDIHRIKGHAGFIRNVDCFADLVSLIASRRKRSGEQDYDLPAGEHAETGAQVA